MWFHSWKEEYTTGCQFRWVRREERTVMFLAVKNCGTDKAVCTKQIVVANQPIQVMPLFPQTLHSLPVVMVVNHLVWTVPSQSRPVDSQPERLQSSIKVFPCLNQENHWKCVFFTGHCPQNLFWVFNVSQCISLKFEVIRTWCKYSVTSDQLLENSRAHLTLARVSTYAWSLQRLC